METKRKSAKVAVSLLALAALVVFTLTAGGGSLEPSAPPAPTMKTLDEVEPRIPVQSLSGSASAMYVINQPGSYYLTGNINVATSGLHGIQVDSNDVTIDLNGFALIGPGKLTPGAGSGIHANSVYNLTVTNGTIRDFREKGIYLFGTGGNHLLKNLKVSDNRSSGIEANVHSTIIDCTVANNFWDGIFADSCIVVNCTSISNNRGRVPVNSIVMNCTAHDNSNVGFQAINSTVINSVANNNNSVAGIYAQGSTVNNCTANNNVNGAGIYAYDTSTIIGCTAIGNGNDGIWARQKSTVMNCTAISNSSDGIEADWTSRMEANHLRYNGGYGLNLSMNASNYAIRNVGSNNSSGNFYSAGANNYMPTTGDNANYGF